jgi:hypothetical protein
VDRKRHDRLLAPPGKGDHKRNAGARRSLSAVQRWLKSRYRATLE